jgi:hypothetical protein
MINQNFVFVGAILAAIGLLSYLIDTIQGKVQPNRVSFFLWSIVPLIAFIAEIQQGVGLQSVLTFESGFFPLLVFIASFVNKNAEWKVTRFDCSCGAFSIIGLLLWYLTKSGNTAIFFSILADGLAGLPTLVKSFNHPATESGWPYFMTALSGVLTVLTVKEWNFATVGFPAYLTLVSLTIYSLVQFKLGKMLRASTRKLFSQRTP